MATKKKARGSARVGGSQTAEPATKGQSGRRPSKAPAPRSKLAKRIVLESLRAGRQKADRVLKSRAKALRSQLATFALRDAGLLIFEGDSWFNYPLGTDIRWELRNLGYEVESNAYRGKRLKEMFDYPQDLEVLIGRQTRVPKAVLLSGGGNDIVYNDNDEFLKMLNPANSPRPGWDSAELKKRIDDDLQVLYLKLLAMITQFCVKKWQHPVPILIHGYANPVPDGHPAGPTGPWLKPVFEAQRYVDTTGKIDLAVCTPLMVQLIGRFNAMLKGLSTAAPGLEHVNYVDLRPALSNGADYKDYWANELHPKKHGFKEVTKVIAAKLTALGGLI